MDFICRKIWGGEWGHSAPLRNPHLLYPGEAWTEQWRRQRLLFSRAVPEAALPVGRMMLFSKLKLGHVSWKKQNLTNCQFIYVQWFSYTILSLWVFCTSETGIACNCFIYKTDLVHHLSLRRLAPAIITLWQLIDKLNLSTNSTTQF